MSDFNNSMNEFFAMAKSLKSFEVGYKEGYKDAVEKACEWLYQRQAVDLEVSDIEKFINEFKKAMEGGKE